MPTKTIPAPNAHTAKVSIGLTNDWSAHENCAHIPNAQTLEVFAEMEEIVARIRAGDRSGCMTLQEFFAELYSDDSGGDV